MVRPVLELRWRAPELPLNRDPAKQIEVGFLRFQKEHYRITVGPVVEFTHVVSALAPTVPVPATAYGWGVAMNGEFLDGSALSFADACYAAWAVFVELVPNLAQMLTQAIVWELARSGTDAQIQASEVFVEPGHIGTPTLRASDKASAATPGADPGGLRPAGGAVQPERAAPIGVDGDAVGAGPESAGSAVSAGTTEGGPDSRGGGYAYRAEEVAKVAG